MALEKAKKYSYQVDEFGVVWQKERTVILEDGVEISSANTNRGFLAPGQLSDSRYTDRVNQKTKDIAKIIHTPELVAEYEAKIAEAEARLNDA